MRLVGIGLGEIASTRLSAAPASHLHLRSAGQAAGKPVGGLGALWATRTAPEGLGRFPERSVGRGGADPNAVVRC
jgi:hypothetical protein